jgi:hypothetical protein
MEYNSLLDLSEKTVEKMKNSELRITGRDEWPGICEEKTRDDIAYLKLLRDRVMD